MMKNTTISKAQSAVVAKAQEAAVKVHEQVKKELELLTQKPKHNTLAATEEEEMNIDEDMEENNKDADDSSDEDNEDDHEDSDNDNDNVEDLQLDEVNFDDDILEGW
jgi:hypothetical protein